MVEDNLQTGNKCPRDHIVGQFSSTRRPCNSGAEDEIWARQRENNRKITQVRPERILEFGRTVNIESNQTDRNNAPVTKISTDAPNHIRLKVSSIQSVSVTCQKYLLSRDPGFNSADSAVPRFLLRSVYLRISN